MKKWEVGQRVELHPAMDAWMRGDRFGTVIGLGRKREYVDYDTGEYFWVRPTRVKLDKSGKVIRAHPDHLNQIRS